MQKNLNWLIVEDALRDQKGHWGEYVATFHRGFLEVNDSVEILCDSHAEDWLVTQLSAKPVLPHSIWHRMSEGGGKVTRLVRILLHAWQTFREMRQWLRENPNADIIFVPTVLVHHLLGWWLLIQGPLKKSQTTILLFFPNTPVQLGPAGKGFLPPYHSSRLFGWLIKKLAAAVKGRRVILGAETRTMRLALEEATEVPFVYLPHPVSRFATLDCLERPLTMAVYGPARHEKGSDILQKAIVKHFRNFPESKTRFVIQWLDDFHDDEGRLVRKSRVLDADARVEYVTSYFGPGEYARRLGQTDLLLLPYRCSSYDLRVSRVVIEAMVHGIPVIATRGTTLEEQAQIHGVCIPCEDGCAESLQKAIAHAELNICKLRSLAQERAPTAREHFSVKHFRDLLMNKIADRTVVHPRSLNNK